jgi:hypothetical protein
MISNPYCTTKAFTILLADLCQPEALPNSSTSAFISHVASIHVTRFYWRVYTGLIFDRVITFLGLHLLRENRSSTALLFSVIVESLA